MYRTPTTDLFSKNEEDKSKTIKELDKLAKVIFGSCFVTLAVFVLALLYTVL